jgi:hypothetical protein
MESITDSSPSDYDDHSRHAKGDRVLDFVVGCNITGNGRPTQYDVYIIAIESGGAFGAYFVATLARQPNPRQQMIVKVGMLDADPYLDMAYYFLDDAQPKGSVGAMFSTLGASYLNSASMKSVGMTVQQIATGDFGS